MIDLHAHVLAGVDDGPGDLGSAVELVASAAEAGTRTIVATSHVSERFPNRPAGLAAAREELRSALATAGVDVDVQPGAEVAIGALGDLTDSDLAGLRLGTGHYLLIESPLSSAAGDFEFVLDRVLGQGHGVVLAHPERCPAFQREPARLAALVERGALVSLTASALTGRFGRTVHAFAIDLLCGGMVHNVASDAHGAGGRGPTVLAHLDSASAEVAGLGELAPWLTTEVPEAILAGRPVAPAPLLERTRSRRRFRRRRVRS